MSISTIDMCHASEEAGKFLFIEINFYEKKIFKNVWLSYSASFSAYSANSNVFFILQNTINNIDLFLGC